tara:strand:- start:475 stop:696 length:222 start_codon:yes stop_codon:yes gene_type:complete
MEKIIHIKNGTAEQFEALKAFMKALKIKFEEQTANADMVIPQWQIDEVRKRRANASKDDYVSWEDIESKLKFD